MQYPPHPEKVYNKRHAEKISNSYNNRHASDFARKTSEKKYLEPWGLSLMKIPSPEFENTTVLFSPDEEFRFFRALHFVKYRLKKAYHQKQRERYYKIYLAMRNRAIGCNWPLVPSCVRKHLEKTPPGVDIAHLLEQGYFALISAGDCFNPWYGFRLSTYACTAIKRSLYRHKKERVEFTNITPDISTSSTNANEEWIAEQLVQIINSNLLTEREKKIISMRFGFSGYDDNLTLETVGSFLGITKERTRQIQHATITKLKTQLKLQIDGFQDP